MENNKIKHEAHLICALSAASDVSVYFWRASDAWSSVGMIRSSFFTSSKGSNAIFKLGWFIASLEALATTPQPPFLLENLTPFTRLQKGSEGDREGTSFNLSEIETQTDEEVPKSMIRRLGTTLKSEEEQIVGEV